MDRELEQHVDRLVDLGSVTSETKGQGGSQQPDYATGQRFNPPGLDRD